ncbi:ATP-binding cassette domain-containing protein [Desulfotalea psychrophila]|uniref:Probable ABC transporter, ATP-binding protein n=1 Tax=Desulfotalea psychrophila (strain LSv54 / DSM 12343) TaxID=177439 RepID=Q6AN01_DESPS|nr:ATP-binding cassette domain-containing protein [Desulfotalea psychrophila]CAG36273.1 probable ABC transporter, ATP-binding protein [Desulfotalea psychrophila LSv54]
MAPILEISDLVVRFGSKTALDGISFSAEPGQIIGFIGPDGAGKTTLLRTMASLILPDSGQARMLGHNICTDLDALRCQIGYMPQQCGLYEDLTVQENLDLYSDLHGVPSHRRKAIQEKILTSTALAPFVQRFTGKLSGGMKQKLGVACCLLASPKVLILDEPTVGVDPVSRRDLWQIILATVREEGTTVFLASTYLDEVMRCDQAIILNQGKILFNDSPDKITERVKGRVFLLPATAGKLARDSMIELSRDKEISHVGIDCGSLRVITGRPDTFCPAYPQAKACPPLFADAFMDIWAENVSPPQLIQMGEDSGGKREEVVVRVEGLQKKFGEFTAVEDTTFEVKRGEIFGLLGGNGAGKTTIFRMLCGLLRASSGSITIAGHDLLKSPGKTRARLGYMAQKFSLYTQLSVIQNLRFFGRAYNLGGKKLTAKIERALIEFNLDQHRDDAAGLLPAGHRQRLAMASASLHNPDILFLDEPTSGTDPLARREFWLRISSFAQKGMTVIVTTHYMEEAEFCDKILIMAKGKILAMGTPKEIRKHALSAENPNPSIEDAFIQLVEEGDQ